MKYTYMIGINMKNLITICSNHKIYCEPNLDDKCGIHKTYSTFL